MTETFVQAFILLILVTDPFGNVPIFVSAMQNVERSRRWKVVVRECLIAYGILLLFMFFGRTCCRPCSCPRFRCGSAAA